MGKCRLLFVLFAISNTSFAADWIGPYPITRFETNGSSVYFLRAEKFPNPQNCNSANYVQFEPSGDLVKSAIDIALAAKMSGKQVRYLPTGNCTSDGYIGVKAIEIWEVATAADPCKCSGVSAAGNAAIAHCVCGNLDCVVVYTTAPSSPSISCSKP